MDSAHVEAAGFKASDLFDGISDVQYDEILSRGERKPLESGTVLFREKDPARAFFMVSSGRLKLSKLHEQGKEAVIRYIGPGEITAATAVFKDGEYPATSEAVGHTEVVCWDRRTMTEIMLAYPQLAANMLGIVIERLGELQDRFLELYAEQVERRIARSLLRIMRKSGRRTEDGIEIGFPLSRQTLADYAGTTLYTVSRTLSSWEKKGWISSRREHIVVCDPHSLVMFADSF
jgi:CRP-like cAMP-binding protein